MFERTHNEITPWYVVRADDKKRARLNVIRHLMSLVDCPGKDEHAAQPDPEIVFASMTRDNSKTARLPGDEQWPGRSSVTAMLSLRSPARQKGTLIGEHSGDGTNRDDHDDRVGLQLHGAEDAEHERVERDGRD